MQLCKDFFNSLLSLSPSPSLPPSLSRSLLQNALMQQPLAHLYFLTVLEHLMTQQWLLSGFVRLANSISEMCSSPEVCDRDKVLLWIELQAVVQVIAQNVPHHLDPSKQDNIVQFNPLREDINRYAISYIHLYYRFTYTLYRTVHVRAWYMCTTLAVKTLFLSFNNM